ncbi:MAG: transposase, partial [Bacteroidales bacterium]
MSRISVQTGVDYYSKVLSGKLMFYLLLYGTLHSTRLSQSGLCDIFSSPLFRVLFSIKGKRELSHRSISERLSRIDVSFFRQVYECLYSRLSSLYTKKEIAGIYLERVDSTLVSESSNKLKSGLTMGNQKYQGKMIKYTITFDGIFASLANSYSDKKFSSATLPLLNNVLEHYEVLDRYLKKEEVNYPNGKPSQHMFLCQTPFRIIRFRVKGKDSVILLITNIMHLSASEIASMYKERWKIEVFFRFIKQELKFSHFLSLDNNGIEVFLYMSVITAMLVMIYKKENQLGYRTTTRRVMIELESLATAIIVLPVGGDVSKTELPEP